jgi:hypothetical protein
MYNANLKMHAEINKNVCFIMELNKYLINRNQKYNVNMETLVTDLDVDLSILINKIIPFKIKI